MSVCIIFIGGPMDGLHRQLPSEAIHDNKLPTVYAYIVDEDHQYCYRRTSFSLDGHKQVHWRYVYQGEKERATIRGLEL